jgi:hypothetical protein
MILFNRIIEEAKNNYKRLVKGEDINIPFPFKKFRKYVPGIQQGRYTIFTANSKVMLY